MSTECVFIKQEPRTESPEPHEDEITDPVDCPMPQIEVKKEIIDVPNENDDLPVEFTSSASSSSPAEYSYPKRPRKELEYVAHRLCEFLCDDQNKESNESILHRNISELRNKMKSGIPDFLDRFHQGMHGENPIRLIETLTNFNFPKHPEVGGSYASEGIKFECQRERDDGNGTEEYNDGNSGEGDGPDGNSNGQEPGNSEDRKFHVVVKCEPAELLALRSEDASDEVPISTFFRSNGDMWDRQVTTDGKFACPMCDKTYVNKKNVQRHMSVHARTKHYCMRCSKEFSSEKRLDRHMASHAAEKPNFPCTECKKQFKSSSNLVQHMKSHSVEKPFVCELCHRQFTIKSNMLRHQYRCKQRMGEPIICHVCNKQFLRESLLKSHLMKHSTERPFSCDLCGMDFKHKSTIIRHMQWHNGNRPYSCKVCKKTFTSAGLIKPHMRVHTGEKPYQCPICAKYFAHKHNMVRHKNRHDRIKILVCDICNKKFPKESRLIYHMRTHVNEKYFACDICPKKFSHKQNITRHYAKKHPGFFYKGTDTDASVALRVWDKVKDTFVAGHMEEPQEILG